MFFVFESYILYIYFAHTHETHPHSTVCKYTHNNGRATLTVRLRARDEFSFVGADLSHIHRTRNTYLFSSFFRFSFVRLQSVCNFYNCCTIILENARNNHKANEAIRYKFSIEESFCNKWNKKQVYILTNENRYKTVKPKYEVVEWTQNDIFYDLEFSFSFRKW